MTTATQLRSRLHRGAALTALALAVGAAAPAFAQDSNAVTLGEVIITAQKRSENLQDVPVSVATMGGEKLEALFAGGEDVLALSSRVPGLFIESSNGRAAPRFYIRGLGNTDFDLAASQPVSVIMDDVVMENVVLKSTPVFDVEQVEVLRGPQGTLFGRNTTAGIVKFDSVKPSQTFKANGTVTYGSYGSWTAEGGVGGPLVEGKLAGRIAVLGQHRDNYIDNTFTHVKDAMGGYDEYAIRGQLLWTPTEDLSVLLNAHNRTLDGTAAIFRANILTKGSNKINGNFDRDSVFYNGGDNNPQKYDGNGEIAEDRLRLRRRHPDLDQRLRDHQRLQPRRHRRRRGRRRPGLHPVRLRHQGRHRRPGPVHPGNPPGLRHRRPVQLAGRRLLLQVRLPGDHRRRLQQGDAEPQEHRLGRLRPGRLPGQRQAEAHRRPALHRRRQDHDRGRLDRPARSRSRTARSRGTCRRSTTSATTSACTPAPRTASAARPSRAATSCSSARLRWRSRKRSSRTKSASRANCWTAASASTARPSPMRKRTRSSAPSAAPPTAPCWSTPTRARPTASSSTASSRSPRTCW
jgi:hypothetical protein